MTCCATLSTLAEMAAGRTESLRQAVRLVWVGVIAVDRLGMRPATSGAVRRPCAPTERMYSIGTNANGAKPEMSAGHQARLRRAGRRDVMEAGVGIEPA